METDLLAWTILGAAAGLAGMMYPFRRGLAGVIYGLLSGMAGSVAFGLTGLWLVQGSPHHRAIWSMLFAAAGAFATVVLVHAAYSRWLPSKRLAPPGRARQ